MTLSATISSAVTMTRRAAKAVGVGALGVDDGDVGVEGRHGVEHCAAIWVGNGAVGGVGGGQVIGAGGLHGQEGQASGARGEAGDHGEVGVLLVGQPAGFELGAHLA
jgi:hypothetical protein